MAYQIQGIHLHCGKYRLALDSSSMLHCYTLLCISFFGSVFRISVQIWIMLWICRICSELEACRFCGVTPQQRTRVFVGNFLLLFLWIKNKSVVFTNRPDTHSCHYPFLSYLLRRQFHNRLVNSGDYEIAVSADTTRMGNDKNA